MPSQSDLVVAAEKLEEAFGAHWHRCKLSTLRKRIDNGRVPRGLRIEANWAVRVLEEAGEQAIREAAEHGS